jgi:hypothetical protein
VRNDMCRDAIGSIFLIGVVAFLCGGCTERPAPPAVIEVKRGVAILDNVPMSHASLEMELRRRSSRHGPFPVAIIASPTSNVGVVIDIVARTGSSDISLSLSGSRTTPVRFRPHPGEITYKMRVREIIALFDGKEASITTNADRVVSPPGKDPEQRSPAYKSMVFFWTTPDAEAEHLFHYLSQWQTAGYGIYWGGTRVGGTRVGPANNE